MKKETGKMIVGFMFGISNLSIDQEGWAYCLMADRCLKHHWKLIAQERYVKWEVNGLGDGGMAYGGEAAWSYQTPALQERAGLADYVIPDELLVHVREQEGGVLPASVFLQKHDYLPLVELLDSFFDDMETKGECIEAVMTYPKAIQSLVTVLNRRGLRLVVFEAGPLRFPGYHGTAFFCEGDPHWADRCGLSRRYQEFNSLWPEKCRLLSNREMLALLLRDEFLPFLKLYGIEPQWEALVCGSYMFDAQTMGESSVTPLDLLEKAKNDYGENFHFRPDPGDRLHITFGLPEERVDWNMPNILSLIRSRHVLTIAGNIMLDAMLWGKTVDCMEKKSALYEFCQPGVHAGRLLNYYIFAFLAPMELATTEQYLRWRLTDPNEVEIYRRHLDYYLSQYGLDRSVFGLSEEETVLKILSARSASLELAQPLLRLGGEGLDDFWSRAEAAVGYRKNMTTAERIAEAEEKAQMAQEQCRDAQEAARQAKEQERQAQAEMHQAKEQVQTAQQQVMQAQEHASLAQEQAAWALMHTVLMRKEADQAHRKEEQMQRQKEQTEASLQAVLDSTSWRITSPLRKIKKAAGNLWKRKQ